MMLDQSGPYEVRVIRDVVYGRAGVNFSNERYERDLKLDVYEPATSTTELRPAIILAFGGAFHRGSKEDDSFSIGEGKNTSVSWYAHHWARMGFVTFSIDYRLIPEDPDPGNTPVLRDLESAGTDRMHAVRNTLGLGATTDQLIANGIEAGSDDMAMAARFVLDNSARWHIDPLRIGLWGWSAGARNALHAVFAERFPATSVVALSAYIHPTNLETMLDRPNPAPRLLLISAERDLPHIREGAANLVKKFKQKFPDVEGLLLRDTDHFYPSSSVIERKKSQPITLEQAMTRFFIRTLAPTWT